MIEDYLMNYGVLGIWTMSLLIEKFRTQKRMTEILEKIERKLA